MRFLNLNTRKTSYIVVSILAVSFFLLVAMLLWTTVSEYWLHPQLDTLNQERNNMGVFLKSEERTSEELLE